MPVRKEELQLQGSVLKRADKGVHILKGMRFGVGLGKFGVDGGQSKRKRTHVVEFVVLLPDGSNL